MAHHIVAQKNVVVDLKMYGTGADHTETTKDKKCCVSNHFDHLNFGRKLLVLFIKDDMTLKLTTTWYSKLGCCFKTSGFCWGFFYKFLWRGTMSMPTSRWHKFSSSPPPPITKQYIFLFLNNQYNHSMNVIIKVKSKS